MVHRKSEYRLQYNFLPENIRKQIWEDNVNLRSCRKLSNQAHHYWEYQLTDDNCVCDGDEEEEDDPGPPPPHKLKHKHLLAQYRGRSQSCNGLNKHCNNSELEKSREIAVQTPNWRRSKEKESETDSGRASSEELQEVMKNMSTLSLPDVQLEGRNSAQRPPTPVPPPSPSSQRQSRPSSALNRHQRSRTPGPTRTNKKLHIQGKKTHFVPFGWNNSETEVGKKKTFNVSAPEREVFHPAVVAARKRNAEVEKYIREDMEKQRHRTTVPYPFGNPSSIWMTEYKEKFCRSRPGSAPPPPS